MSRFTTLTCARVQVLRGPRGRVSAVPRVPPRPGLQPALPQRQPVGHRSLHLPLLAQRGLLPGTYLQEMRVCSSASKSSIRRFVITEKAPTRAFSWLKAATTAFTFKTLLIHYAKWAAIRHYANQPPHPLCLLRWQPNFLSTYCGVNACLA